MKKLLLSFIILFSFSMLNASNVEKDNLNKSQKVSDGYIYNLKLNTALVFHDHMYDPPPKFFVCQASVTLQDGTTATANGIGTSQEAACINASVNATRQAERSIQ